MVGAARSFKSRQGCAKDVQWPRAFQYLVDYIMPKTTPRLSLGLNFGDRAITDVDFADDLAILADSTEKLLEALRILREEAAKVGLHINWNITKIMAIDPSSSAVNSVVSLDSTTGNEVVQYFTYTILQARFSPSCKRDYPKRLLSWAD